MQHQDLDHPKVISVPLGVNSRSPALWSMLKKDTEHRKCKEVNWIMINLGTWGQRPAISKRLLRIFPHLTNTYKQGSGLDYLRCVPACTHVLVSLLCMLCVREIKCSRFVMCASGYGPDTYLCLVFRCSACIYTAVPHRYRIWETLVLGAIPVVERRPEYGGWLRVLDELPVLWVKSFGEVTQELLEEQYPSIIQGQYNYKRLTTKWWLNHIAGLLNQTIDASANVDIDADSPRENSTEGTDWSLFCSPVLSLGTAGEHMGKAVPKKNALFFSGAFGVLETRV